MSKWLIMAGGTGGHIFPALATAQELQKLNQEVIWLGSENSMESKKVPQYDIDIKLLPMKGVRRNGLLRKLTMPFTLGLSTWKAIKIIRENNIDGVIGFGGFITVPGILAAKALGRKIIIHEQNAVAGLANRLGQRYTDQVFCSFEGVLEHAQVVGNPVREDILSLPSVDKRFGSRKGDLRLLIVGGSLGAEFLNTTIPRLFKKIDPKNRPFIVHQTGKNRLQLVTGLYRETLKDEFASDEELNEYMQKHLQIVEFIDDMAKVYSEADYIICRSGALTVSELAAVGLGGYLVPYPFAVDDHQTHNAMYLANQGACEIIQQKDVNLEEWAQKMSELKRRDCHMMAKKAHQVAKTDAAKIIAQRAIELVGTTEK